MGRGNIGGRQDWEFGIGWGKQSVIDCRPLPISLPHMTEVWTDDGSIGGLVDEEGLELLFSMTVLVVTISWNIRDRLGYSMRRYGPELSCWLL